MNLRATLEALANDFAANVVQAMRGATLEELLVLANQKSALSTLRASSKGEPRARPRGGRLGRRTAEALAELGDEIASILAKHPDGLRAEQLRTALGVEAKELPRPLADALREGKITKTGQKRATTYFAAAGAARRLPRRKA
jgi:hypothetical protein